MKGYWGRRWGQLPRDEESKISWKVENQSGFSSTWSERLFRKGTLYSDGISQSNYTEILTPFPKETLCNLMEFYKLSTIYTSVIQFHPSVGQSLRNTPLTVFDMELNLSIISNVRRASRVNISCKWKSEKAKVVKVQLQRQRRCSTSWPSTHLLHISQIYIFT